MKFYTFIRESDLNSVMEHGLASSIAISKNPKILSHIFKDKDDQQNYIQSINPRDITQKGPSIFFQKPLPVSEILEIDPDHILGEDNYILLELDYESIKKEENVDVFGLELEPYYSDEDYEIKKDKIEGDLTEDSIESLSAMSAEEAWKDFSPSSGYFAPNVPHGVIITDSGYVKSKYIKVSNEYMRKESISNLFSLYKLSKKKKRKRGGKLTSKPSSEKTLRDWFARKGGKGSSSGWVDCNTCRKGKCKPCGRQEGEKRSKYPACRPTPASCKKYKKTKGKSWGKGGKKKKKSNDLRELFLKISKELEVEKTFENELGNEISVKIKEVSDKNKDKKFDAVSMSIEGPTSVSENIITYMEAMELQTSLQSFLDKNKKRKSTVE